MFRTVFIVSVYLAVDLVMSAKLQEVCRLLVSSCISFSDRQIKCYFMEDLAVACLHEAKLSKQFQ